MKTTIKSVISLLLIVGTCFAQEIPTDSLYLGQTPPGITPKIFNLPVTNGLVAAERITISSDNKEIYYGELNGWPASSQRIKCYKYINNKWQGPTVVFEDFVAPSLSPNDSIMYIQNNIGTTYYSKRISAGWSVPQKLLAATGTHYYQQTNLKNCFTASTLPNSPGGNTDICKLKITGTDTSLVSFGLPTNTSAVENDFYIARNEAYNIICRFNNGYASDLFISYKNNQGKWTNPKTLGTQVNTPNPNWEACPFVTKDNKYLFFMRGGNSMSSYFIYWVAIENLIQQLKTTNYPPYLNKAIPSQTDSLGRSYSYTVPDTTFFDDDGNNTLTYTATLSNGSALPAWLTFDPNTRTLSGTLQQLGTYSIKITAKDTLQATALTSFTLKVINKVSIADDKKFEQLVQAYPNPFNPTTSIKFNIEENAMVRLSVYNLQGELIKELVNDQLQAGLHNYSFDAKGLTSGVYVYKLQIGSKSIIKSMLLLK